jgi:DNA-binding Xre family transcriptional regulator
VITVRWKLKEYLEAHNLTAYQLWKASGLSKTGVYNLVTPKGLERATGVEFGTLAKLISGLEKLTGRCVSLDDLLEVVRDSK